MLAELEKAIYASTENKRFFDVADFPWVKDVEACWESIQGELSRVLKAIDVLPGFEEIQQEQGDLSQDKRWKIFPLFAYGTWMGENERRCPETARALRMIPELQAAMFSILQAKKELPPHRGIFGGVLRYHLGLKVPTPETQCGISVDGIVAHWKNGESMIFDDAFMHHAWNHSNEDRVVLFVDFTRPLPANLAAMNEMVLSEIRKSPFILNAVNQWHQWERINGAQLDQLLESA